MDCYKCLASSTAEIAPNVATLFDSSKFDQIEMAKVGDIKAPRATSPSMQIITTLKQLLKFSQRFRDTPDNPESLREYMTQTTQLLAPFQQPSVKISDGSSVWDLIDGFQRACQADGVYLFISAVKYPVLVNGQQSSVVIPFIKPYRIVSVNTEFSVNSTVRLPVYTLVVLEDLFDNQCDCCIAWAAQSGIMVCEQHLRQSFFDLEDVFQKLKTSQKTGSANPLSRLISDRFKKHPSPNVSERDLQAFFGLDVNSFGYMRVIRLLKTFANIMCAVDLSNDSFQLQQHRSNILHHEIGHMVARQITNRATLDTVYDECVAFLFELAFANTRLAFFNRCHLMTKIIARGGDSNIEDAYVKSFFMTLLILLHNFERSNPRFEKIVSRRLQHIQQNLESLSLRDREISDSELFRIEKKMLRLVSIKEQDLKNIAITAWGQMINLLSEKDGKTNESTENEYFLRSIETFATDLFFAFSFRPDV